MNTALAVTVEEEMALRAQLENLDLSPAGMENLEPGDTGMPPRLRISQNNRPVEIGDTTVPGGNVVNVLTGQHDKSLEIIVLMYLPRTRVCWPPTFSADNSPLCLSNDGKYPVNADDIRATNPMSGPCASCPYSQFDDDGTPPQCQLQRNFLVSTQFAESPGGAVVYQTEAQEIAILTLSSTATKAAKTLTALSRTGGLKRTITMTTQEIKSDKGNWFVPAFTKGSKLLTVQIIELVGARDELKNLVVTADLQNGSGQSVEPEQRDDFPQAPPPEEDFDEFPF